MIVWGIASSSCLSFLSPLNLSPLKPTSRSETVVTWVDSPTRDVDHCEVLSLRTEMAKALQQLRLCTVPAGCPASAGNGESVRPLRSRSERMKKERKHYTAEEKVAILR